MFKKDFILEIIEIIWVSRKLQKGFDPIVLRLKYRHWRMAALIGTSELMGQLALLNFEISEKRIKLGSLTGQKKINTAD